MGILDCMALAWVGFCGAAGRAGGIEVVVVVLGSGGAKVDLGGAEVDFGGAKVDSSGAEVASRVVWVDSMD